MASIRTRVTCANARETWLGVAPLCWCVGRMDEHCDKLYLQYGHIDKSKEHEELADNIVTKLTFDGTLPSKPFKNIL